MRAATTLDATPIDQLHGIGPKLVEKLNHLGLRSVADLLFHLPLRYEDRSRVVALGALSPGRPALIEGRIELADVVFRRRRALLVRISDGTGQLTLRFFHFSAAQQNGMRRGSWLRCYGEVRAGPSSLEMVHPEYQQISEDQRGQGLSGVTPVYPATEGVQQRSWRKWIGQVLDGLHADDLPDWLPESVLRQHGWPPLTQALWRIHRPASQSENVLHLDGRSPVQQRLAFEELLAHRLSLLQLKTRHQRRRAPVCSAQGPLLTAFFDALPFQLTAAQQRVIQDIQRDLQSGVPMQRLLQGDVGSGKTVVCAVAALMAVDAGCQVVLMAPTELLAEQHRATFSAWFDALGIQSGLLTSSLKALQRQAVLQALLSGVAQIVIGTHAVFQESVEFNNLGLVLIDEQHRFGVHQRMALRDKGRDADRLPHQLVMTATPIPRTLAMLGYADLDLSVIDELPPGRTPVVTAVLPTARRDEVMTRIEQSVAEGRQVYWVCPLVEESERLQCQAAEVAAELLQSALPQVRVGLVHGRMKTEAKNQIMQAFKAGQMDVLVATTVIEVGVDVPNASLMVIENAERLGLAQLHQLRGRVGRGSTQSYCLLLYQAPLSEAARQRLTMLRETEDGFRIADKDLEMRGPGELLGTRQAGALRLRVADLQRDQGMLGEVSRVASEVLRDSPENAQALIRRWLGDSVQYRDV